MTEVLHAQAIQIMTTAERLELLVDQHISMTATKDWGYDSLCLGCAPFHCNVA